MFEKEIIDDYDKLLGGHVNLIKTEISKRFKQ